MVKAALVSPRVIVWVAELMTVATSMVGAVRRVEAEKVGAVTLVEADTEAALAAPLTVTVDELRVVAATLVEVKEVEVRVLTVPVVANTPALKVEAALAMWAPLVTKVEAALIVTVLVLSSTMSWLSPEVKVMEPAEPVPVAVPPLKRMAPPSRLPAAAV